MTKHVRGYWIPIHWIVNTVVGFSFTCDTVWWGKRTKRLSGNTSNIGESRSIWGAARNACIKGTLERCQLDWTDKVQID
jgi:hypothetical protein